MCDIRDQTTHGHLNIFNLVSNSEIMLFK
uniref:Uncharacterized protein n=1 Tax=Rhizophora mucronata TaxID=61149 RepID=A0A2P2QAA6_RHIMU